MLKFLFGTRLERAEAAYTKHERKYHELMSKATMYRGLQNYDMARVFETTAENHYNMMVALSKMIEKLKLE